MLQRAATNPLWLAAQVAAIIAVGLIAGLIDRRAWDAKLKADAPPAKPPVVTFPVAPPVAQTPEKPVVVPQPAPAADAPKPGDPGWKPATDADLRGKPGHITLQDAFDRHSFKLATFLDARKLDEFIAGHIPGARLAPLSDFRADKPPAILSAIAKDSPIVVYCAGGDCEASEDVAIILQNAGHTQVFILHDGYPGWAALGFPTEAGEPKQ